MRIRQGLNHFGVFGGEIASDEQFMENVHKGSEVTLSVRIGYSFLRPSVFDSIHRERDTVGGMCCGGIIEDIDFGWGYQHNYVSAGT